jgi:hypothetical protein
VGLGGATAALRGAVLFIGVILAINALVFYAYARMIAGPWREVKARVSRLKSAKRGGWLMSGYILHRLSVIGSVVAFVALTPRDPDQRISLWLVEVSRGVAWVGGFIAIWILLGRVSVLFRDSDLRTEADRGEDERRNKAAGQRFAVRVTAWIMVPLAAVFLGAPLYWAGKESQAVVEGHSVSGYPAILWQATPASIDWLGEPSSVMEKIGTHCLMYLGAANGVTILYDVKDQVTLRLPTADLVVRTVPVKSSDVSQIRSRC